MIEATDVTEKQKLSPIEQVKNIVVSLELEGANEGNLSKKINEWMQEFRTGDLTLACVEKLHQRLFNGDTNVRRTFKEVYGGAPTAEYLLQLIDPDKILDDESVQKIINIWT